MQNKTILSISVDRDLSEQIEKSRGLIKRSTFVNQLLRKVLAVQSKLSDSDCNAALLRPE
jgi:metal-responsive CopG/Arc/MetJ family transcriptional regulator